MKKNILTKLLALVMAIVMLLGTCSTALADFTIASYDAALKKAVDAYYAEIMACTTYVDVLNVFESMLDREYDAFVTYVTGDEKAQLEAHMASLLEEHKAMQRYAPVVFQAYTRVAPFLPAVSEASAVSAASYSTRDANDNAGGEDEESSTLVDNPNIITEKSVSDPVDGVYTITLKTYVTGAKTVTTVTQVTPTDIVLVLDQSGSMAYCIGCGKEIHKGSTHSEITGYNEVYGTLTREHYYGFSSTNMTEYFIQTPTGNYATVRNPTSDNNGYYYYQYTNDAGETKSVYPKLQQNFETDANRADSYKVEQFYTATYTNVKCSSRNDALKTAVTNFTNAVKEKTYGSDGIAGTTDDVHHRVALVGFASESDYGYNTEILTATRTNSGSVGVRYNGSGYKTAVQSALQDMSTTAGQTMVTNAINALATEGATRSDLGMKMAVDIFENAPAGVDVDEQGQALTRKKIVIMFTDGTPTSQSAFSETVAGGAISNAKELKDDGVTVYTVGVFKGADATRLPTTATELASVSNENKYMHYTSSNFENATSFDSPGTATYPATGSYYLSAANSSDLNSIFTAISNQVTTGGTSVTLEETTVIKDIVADSFQLPVGADESAIKVYTEDYTAANTFTNKQEITDDVTVSVNSDTISVNGFDYGDNWVGMETTDGKVTYRGKRLLIEIPIVVKPDFLGGNDVPTNGDSSGVYTQAGTILENYTRPDVDIALKTVQPNVTAVVEAVNQHIYLTNDAELKELVVGMGNYKIGDELYKVNGTNNKYVDLIYEIKDGNTVIGTYTIAAGQMTGTWVQADKQDMTPALTEDKTYTVRCTVHPISEGKYSDVYAEATVAVYVYKPQLTFKDGTIDYNTAFPNDDTLNEGTNGGYVSVLWKNDDRLSTDVTMLGTKPALTKTYDPISGVDANTNLVTDTEKVPVQVAKVTANGKDIANDCIFIRQACTIVGEKTGTACDWTETKESENGPAFVLHVVKVSGDLTIVKKIVDAKGNEITTDTITEFDVKVTLKDTKDTLVSKTYKLSDGSDVEFTDGVATVKVKYGTNVVIKDIEYGYKFAVAEDPAVLAGYRLKEYQNETGTMTADGHTTTIINYQTTDLSITKKVTGAGSSKEDVFSFTVTLLDANDTTSKYRYTISPAGDSATEGELTNNGLIQLKHGQTALIKDVPVGAAYTVIENVPDDYTTENATMTGEINVDASKNKLEYLNVHNQGKLKINKKFSNGSTTDTAVFIIKNGDKEYQRVSITGTDSVVVALPYGSYTIAEDDWSWNYDTTVSGDDSFTFSKDKLTHEVSYTNTSDDKWLNEEIKERNEFE